MFTKQNIRFPGGKAKALTLSYDDGITSDIRLVELFNRYNLKATFNLNGSGFNEDEEAGSKHSIGDKTTAISLSKAKEIYKGHEVALHGFWHLNMSNETTAKCMQEVVLDRQKLEKEFGGIIRGMAYAYGAYNDEVVEILKKAGIEYSRTCLSTKDFRIPDDWLRMTSTCHQAFDEMEGLAEKFVNENPADNEEAWIFYMWGHSYEYDRGFMDFARMENFAKTVSNKDDVWYATNIEICEYIKAVDRLVYNLDQDVVFNPTSYDLWFIKDGKSVCIKSGETKYIWE